jgi:antitoxin component YwqK of YwqJK toxin-antitoxin module
MSNHNVKRGYYNNGKVCSESYYIKGKLHREDGPAYIWYYENGTIYNHEYWLSGERLTEVGWYSKLTTEQKVNLLYGKDNE